MPPDPAIVSLCTGSGMLDEAIVSVVVIEVVVHVEHDDHASMVLAYRYPDIPNLRDVNTVDWHSLRTAHDGRPVVLCGGYPCQPFSSAGKRKGTEDPRHLWPAIKAGIAILLPDLFIFENVRNHLNLGFDVVLADCAELGYDVTWTLQWASDVGAPHPRARLFIVGRRRSTTPPPDRVPVARVATGRHGGGPRWLAEDGLFGAVEFVGKWPTSGRMVDGCVYPLTLPAGHPDEDQAEEDVPVLLPTPEAKLATSGVDPRQGRRDGGGCGPDLITAVHNAFGDGRQFPTPTARDWKGETNVLSRGRSDGRVRTAADELLPDVVQRIAAGRELLPTPTAKLGDERRGSPSAEVGQARLDSGRRNLDDAVAAHLQLPTPVAADGERTSTHNMRGNPTLAGALLPTPAASAPNDDEGLDTWLARRDRIKATGINGNGMGTPLGIAVQMLPTPEASDASGGRVSFERGGTRASGAKRAVTLATALHHDLPGEELQLMPTPKASDGEKGGPNQRGSSGDLMLPSAVVQMSKGLVLPTPTAQDAVGSRNATAYRDPDRSEHNAGTTLTDVIWQAAGVDGPASEPPPYTPINEWGPYAAAVSRWEAVTRPAPPPTEPGPKSRQRLSPPFPEWMMGWPAGWVTDVPGVPRKAQLKIAGNGVCPQQAQLAIARQLVTIPW